MSLDPYARVANHIETCLNAVFPGTPVVHDRLHESVGSKSSRIGISVGSQGPQTGNMLVMDTEVLIQFYPRYGLKVDPDQRVDPRVVTGQAHKLREYLQGTQFTPSDANWFYLVTGTEYPGDPTGNQTRFEMSVVAKGWNAGLLETS